MLRGVSIFGFIVKFLKILVKDENFKFFKILKRNYFWEKIIFLYLL